jgi:hypothetical protein
MVRATSGYSDWIRNVVLALAGLVGYDPRWWPLILRRAHLSPIPAALDPAISSSVGSDQH